MAKLETTNTPGIFRRHGKGCDRKGRCDCSYVVIWRHRGKQHKETYRTFAEAREAKGQRDAGERRPVARVGLEDYFGSWIETYAGRTARGFAERSRDIYRLSINLHVLPVWGTWKLADVEPADVRELFTAMRDDGMSPARIKGVRAAASAMFSTAVEDRLLRTNPVHGVRIPVAPSDETDDDRAKALTRSELALVLAALPEEWRLFFEFLAHTGVRIGEAVGLSWQHLDLGTRPKVMVREQYYHGQRHRLKSRASRRDLPLSPGMAERLRAHRRDTYRGDGAPVFATKAGTEINRTNLRRRVLKPAAKAVGLTVPDKDGELVAWPSFHTFRHTCASLLFADGRNVKQVAGWLGHSDASFTLRTYVHLLDDGLGDADFLADTASGGNTGATQRPQTAVNDPAAETADSAL